MTSPGIGYGPLGGFMAGGVWSLPAIEIPVVEATVSIVGWMAIAAAPRKLAIADDITFGASTPVVSGNGIKVARGNAVLAAAAFTNLPARKISLVAAGLDSAVTVTTAGRKDAWVAVSFPLSLRPTVAAGGKEAMSGPVFLAATGAVSLAWLAFFDELTRPVYATTAVMQADVHVSTVLADVHVSTILQGNHKAKGQQ